MAEKTVVKSRGGYTLIELLVVLSIIVLLGVVGIPNLFGGNSRYVLNSNAKYIQSMLDDARVRSLAPTQGSAEGAAQMFQVDFGRFPENATAQNGVVAVGNLSTNQVTLSSGVARCGEGQVDGGNLKKIRSLKLSRNIYVQRFYPTNQLPGERTAAVRYAVGQVGFSCGSSTDPSISSWQLDSGHWSGQEGAISQYLVIEVYSSKLKKSLYVTVDRITSQTRITETDPQENFTPVVDNEPPQWTGQDSDLTMNVVCGSVSSIVNLSFPRAIDWVDGASDGSRPVFYDIYGSFGEASSSEPIVSKFFYDLSQDTVRYSFTTRAVSVANQPSTIVIKLWAFDWFRNYTAEPRTVTFAKPDQWDCGGSNSDNRLTPRGSSSGDEAPDQFVTEDSVGLTDAGVMGSAGDGDIGQGGDIATVEGPVGVE
jgi:prepilin-type N-terminal cleavage/methylation domain-containing protein